MPTHPSSPHHVSTHLKQQKQMPPKTSPAAPDSNAHISAIPSVQQRPSVRALMAMPLRERRDVLHGWLLGRCVLTCMTSNQMGSYLLVILTG